MIHLTDTLDSADPNVENVLRCILTLAGSKPAPEKGPEFREIGDCIADTPGELVSGVVNSYQHGFRFRLGTTQRTRSRDGIYIEVIIHHIRVNET